MDLSPARPWTGPWGTDPKATLCREPSSQPLILGLSSPVVPPLGALALPTAPSSQFITGRLSAWSSDRLSLPSSLHIPGFRACTQ